MAWFRTSFQWAGDLYNTMFADWLHVGFWVRSVLLLLMLGIIIYIFSLIFKYVLGPLAVLVYVNMFLRAWNFLITETIQEWIYIRYYSKDSSKYASKYLRLCDKVKHNRATLSDTTYMGILRRGRVRKLSNHMMFAAGIIAILWIGAFGINQEYAMPAWVESNGVDDDYNGYEIIDSEENESEPDEENDEDEIDDIPSSIIYDPGFIVPRQLTANAVLALIEEAQESGGRLRDGPGIAGATIIEMLWGDDLMVYLGYYVPDADVEALYWLRVRSPSGMIGYIGSQLVEVVG